MDGWTRIRSDIDNVFVTTAPHTRETVTLRSLLQVWVPQNRKPATNPGFPLARVGYAVGVRTVFTTLDSGGESIRIPLP